MKTQTLYKLGGLALIIGTVVVSITTALELLVSPYNRYGTALSYNAPVHIAKYLGGIFLVLGITAAYLRQRERSGRLGFAGFVLFVFGFMMTGMPYNVTEFTMDPSLSQQAAVEYLNTVQSNNYAIPLLAAPGFLMVLVGMILFAVATLRARVLPRWTGWLAVAGLVLGVATNFASETGVIPHPPTWMILGMLGYGYAVFAGRTAAGAAGNEPARRHDLLTDVAPTG
ncbi:MAG: hypothetical protein M3Q29_12915 [Chloroflexota bacterium]|nr:hypothetical protein [Chloroflexota bacterium]